MTTIDTARCTQDGQHRLGARHPESECPVSREGQHVDRWGHQDVPEGFILMRRDRVEVGDEVISSHYGRITVSAVTTRGTGPGVTSIHTERFSGDARHEDYEADSLIPCLPHGTPDREVRALATVEALDRMARRVAEALDPTRIDLTQARALLAEMNDMADTTTCSLVKDQGLSDRISRLAGRSVREAVERAADARLAAVTFTDES